MGNYVKSYSLQEIADWQLKDSKSVALPPLQRGFVWNPAKIETLWDSLLRGFPIGAFLLSKNGSEDNDEKYMVLDGQQRATSIALGYYSPWTLKEEDRKFWSLKKIPVLWLDLSPKETESDRKFIARVVTQSHPWGYNCTDNQKTLSSDEKREALKIFKIIYEGKKLTYTGYTQLLTENVFPYDCNLPVPFAFLIESLRQNDWKTTLIKMCEEMLPYKHISTKRTTKGFFEKLSKYINEDKIKPEIIKAVKNLDEINIPAIIVPGKVLQAEDKGENEDPTLFVRLNSEGTEINGEELLYSIYKAAFPRSKDLVEKVGLGFLAPSRVINLSSRLVWSKINNDEYPASMTVKQFKLRIKKRRDNKNFSAELNKFIDSENENSVSKLFDKAIDMLKLKDDVDIPAVFLKTLLNEQELFLMILRWLMLKLEQKPDFEPSKDDAKKLLALLTALRWFCKNTEKYVSTIWDFIGQKDFLTKEILRKPFFRTDDYIMYSLIRPKTLRKFLLDKVVSSHKNLYELYPKKDDEIFKQYAKSLSKNLEDENRVSAVSDGMWKHFKDRLIKNRNLVLFAQRAYINEKFYDFNQIDDLEDTSSPWDWDHIYPEGYVKKKQNIDENTREWTYTIGNLRALALEDNRSEQDMSPYERLGGAEEETDEAIKKGEEIRKYSFVNNDNWEDWKKINGRIYETDRDRKKRAAYLRAVINRLCDIYQEWYDTLNVSELFNL